MKHAHLDYCLECDKVLHLFLHRVGSHYICSDGCLEKWNEKPETERQRIIGERRREHKKENGIGMFRSVRL